MFNRRIGRLAVAMIAAAGLGFGTQAMAQPAKAEPPAKAEQPAAPKQVKKLEAGDKAPELSIEKWVKGEPVTGFEKGKVYVVEFWATWCGPCIASMPHLSELQRQYKEKGVTIIGVTSEDPNNSLEQVESMASDKGDGMGYTVAWDTGRKTSEAWMKAAGQNGIPCSFLVDQTGTIAYIGHPMWLDEPLEMVVAGTWDIKKDTERLKARQRRLNKVYSLVNSDKAAALKAVEEAEAEDPAVAPRIADIKYGLLLETGNEEKGYALGRELYEKAVKEHDAETLNVLAWTIVNPTGNVAKKDLDFALKAALAADEATGSRNAAIIDTLAWVYFSRGDANKAVELETKAIEVATDRMRPELERSLEEFKKGPNKGPG